MSDCIFEIHRLWPSGISRVYSNSWCSCWFEPEILKINQWSHKMYSNKVLNFQESTILNAHTKKVWKLIVGTLYHATITVGIYVYESCTTIAQLPSPHLTSVHALFFLWWLVLSSWLFWRLRRVAIFILIRWWAMTTQPQRNLFCSI